MERADIMPGTRLPSENTATLARPDRDADGRFAPGNPGGPGRPPAASVHEHRAALLDAVDPVRRIIAAMVDAAERGDVQAAKLVLERIFGRVTDTETLERIEALETALLTQDGAA